MANYTAPPWFKDVHDEVIIIRGSDGDSICAMRRATGDRLPEEQDSNAVLLYLAPELFRAVVDLVSVMRRCDGEIPHDRRCTDEEWCSALEDATALIDLLAEEGVKIEDWQPDETHPANNTDSPPETRCRCSIPATVSYPTGSLGESIDDQGWLS